ncbi:hypothetical protein HHI36_012105, partial [Cryptolaemus montrouzieri]
IEMRKNFSQLSSRVENLEKSKTSKSGVNKNENGWFLRTITMNANGLNQRVHKLESFLSIDQLDIALIYQQEEMREDEIQATIVSIENRGGEMNI